MKFFAFTNRQSHGKKTDRSEILENNNENSLNPLHANFNENYNE